MVRGVIARSSCSGLILKPDSAVGDDRYRLAAGEHHHVRIAHPIGRRNDHLVARIERRHEGVVEHLLAAGAHGNLARLVVETVFPLELGDHRRLELGDAVHVGIFGGPAVPDRLDGRFLDVVGGVEIRLAGAEPDDVAARQFERPRLIRDRDRGGRLDALQRVGEKGHDHRTPIDLHRPIEGARFLMGESKNGKPKQPRFVPHCTRSPRRPQARCDVVATVIRAGKALLRLQEQTITNE